jgi:hypothetical protein
MSSTVNLSPFESEVRRWNKQFSLISRQNSETRLQNLLSESSLAYSAFVNWVQDNKLNLDKYSKINYFDIGSGAGFPGIVWQAHLEKDFDNKISGYLVEPRGKRAWFLERSARAMGLKGLSVCNCRWGSQESENPNTDHIALFIVSIKALMLTDPEIIAGLNAPPADSDVLICRFHNPETVLNSELAEKLGLPPKAEVVVFGDKETRSALLISTHRNCST